MHHTLSACTLLTPTPTPNPRYKVLTRAVERRRARLELARALLTLTQRSKARQSMRQRCNRALTYFGPRKTRAGWRLWKRQVCTLVWDQGVPLHIMRRVGGSGSGRFVPLFGPRAACTQTSCAHTTDRFQKQGTSLLLLLNPSPLPSILFVQVL